MKIGILFDLKEDYDIDCDYDDFASLEEVMTLANILSKLNHTVGLEHGIKHICENIIDIKNKYDLVFNLFEGYLSRNREALIPALLELNQIPYIGSDAFANALTLDKFATKLYAIDYNIETPNFALYDYHNKNIHRSVPSSQKLVLKPVCGGTSDGIKFVNESNNLLHEVESIASEYKQNILIEEYIEGSDISVSMFGNPSNGYEVIGAVQTCDTNFNNLDIYDKNLKLTHNVIRIIPKWSEVTEKDIYRKCKTIASAIKLKGFFRIDFRINNCGCYFLEINATPSLLIEGNFLNSIKLNNQDRNEIFRRIMLNENFES